MRMRLAPCIVKEIREYEGSHYITLDAPNETLKAAIRADAPQARDMAQQLVDLSASFIPVDLEVVARAYVTKSGQQIDVQSIQVRPFGNGDAGKKAS